MSDRTSIPDTAVDAAADAARLANAVTQPDSRDGKTLLQRFRDGFTGWPSGGGFDAVRTGAATVLHCFLHGEDNCPCGRNTTMSGANDPTGEAAIRPDRARDDQKQFEKHLRAARRELDQALQIAKRYEPRAANAFDQQEAPASDVGCTSCARITGPSGQPWWNQVTRNTTLKNGVKVGLCDWCYRTPVVGAQFTGDLPPKDEVAYYRDNGRARKRSA